MTNCRCFYAAVLSALVFAPTWARAAKVDPNTGTLGHMKERRILVIDDQVWNKFHEVPKEGTLGILEGFNTSIGFASFTVRDTAANITLEDLNNYDVVIFNYCDNLYNAAGTPFDTTLQQWFATGNKGYMGYHTSGVFYSPPPEGEEWWAWYGDSVTSIRTFEHSGAHTGGTLVKAEDTSMEQSSFFGDLDASFTFSDVWLMLETQPPLAAPTWPDCRVLYNRESDGSPQIWIREDDRGNRFFFSAQFHDAHEKGVESDFNYNLLLRALEYVGGERPATRIHFRTGGVAADGLFAITHDRRLRIDQEGSYGISVLSPAGKQLYFAVGGGEQTFALPAFQKAGLYILSLESKGARSFGRILIR